MTSATTTDSAFGLTHVGQIGITVHDLDRAAAYYRDVLGMRFLFSAPNLAFFDCDGLRLMLSFPERPEYNHPASILYYSVADLRAAHATLRSRGVTFIDEPHLIARMPDHELWMAFFTDTEGNTLGLMSEIR